MVNTNSTSARSDSSEVATALAEAEAARVAFAAAPTESILAVALVVALHRLTDANRRAGLQAESAGLGVEAAGVLGSTAATGPALTGMAENTVYVGAYLPAGDEAVTTTAAAVAVLRAQRAAEPGATIDVKLLWALHNLAARHAQAQNHAGAAGLGVEAAGVLGSTAATGPALTGMAENTVYVGAYLPAGDERVTTGAAAVGVLRDLYEADPLNAGRAEKYGWADSLLTRWRTETGLPPEEPQPQPVVPDPALRQHFTDGTPVSSLSRNPDLMDVFAVGVDGSVQSTWWHGLWRERFRVGTATFPPATPIGVLSRSPDYMDLFAVGVDGKLWGAWWHGEWHDWSPLGDTAFPDRTPVGTLSRNSDQMDVFAVGPDGRVWSNWWHGQWNAWFSVGEATFPERTPIASLSRSPDYMDLFAVGHDHRVWGAWWHGQWHPWAALGDIRFAPGTPIATLSRNSDQMDVFAVGEDGAVWTASWHGQWSPWSRIGAATFPPRATIASVCRDSDHMDLFVCGHDGRVWTAWWNGHWSEWSPIGDPVAPPGSPVSVLSRNPGQLDLFVAADGGIRSTWWHDRWHGWFRLPWSLHSFSRPIDSAGLAALGGWATIAFLDDASTRFYGHAKNSGIDSYGVSLSAVIKPAAGGAHLLFHHYGDVGSHDHHDWDEWLPARYDVAHGLQSYLEGNMHSDLQYSSGIADAVRDTLAWSTTIVVGWTPAGLAVAPIIMMVGSLASWIDTGSPLPGLMATSSAVWMTGPTGMLIAYPVQQFVGLVAESRSMRPDEIAWAAEIFGPTLPVDRIRITKLLGQNDRPFCALTANNLITINMGEASYWGDPRDWKTQAEPGFQAPRKWGETFAHELTHAWQLAHYPHPEFIARVLAAQIEEMGGDPYVYAVGAPWKAYDPEAQASIVSDWYREHIGTGELAMLGLKRPEALDNPRYRYIRDHIRRSVT